MRNLLDFWWPLNLLRMDNLLMNPFIASHHNYSKVETRIPFQNESNKGNLQGNKKAIYYWINESIVCFNEG